MTPVATVCLCLIAAGVWSSTSVAATAAPAASAAPAAPTSLEQSALAAAFAAFKGISLGDVGTLRAGSLHTSYDPSTQGYWGTASFLPSAAASAAVTVKFQDGGGVGVFRSSNGTTWTMTQVGGQPFPCAGQLPATVEAAWGLKNSPYCAATGSVPLTTPRASAGAATAAPSATLAPSASSASSAIAQVAISQVGVGDTPASTNFALDCDPYTTLVGAGATTTGCGVDPHFGVRDENEFWCSDFAKWVWEQGAVAAGVGTLSPASSSFYKWGAQRGDQLIPDGNNAAVGDAVVFYPPGDLTSSGLSFADHVAIVVGVNADGTVNLVNGDFGGTSNISVQLFNEVSIASWASFIWNTGEQWMYISPGAGLAGGNGVPSGTPAALANSPSLMNVFYQTRNRNIENEYWTPTTGWIAQVLPGGGTAGDPAAVANSPTWMNLWFTTTGERVVNDFWVPRTGWLSQTLPGGSAVGDLAVLANSPSLMNVFYATPSGRIENDYWTPGRGWVNQTLPGGNAASAPTAVMNSSTWMNVWYTTRDGMIANDYWTASTGWVSQVLPAGYATGATSGVVNSATSMTVWYTDLDGQIDDLSWTPQAGWTGRALPSSEATGSPYGVVNSAAWMNVWYANNNDQLINIYWTPGTGWVVQTLPGAGVTGSPTAVVHSASAMDVFYTTSSGRIGDDGWHVSSGWAAQLLPAPAGAA